MLNDLHQANAAAADFEAALDREPNDGEAHLGLPMRTSISAAGGRPAPDGAGRTSAGNSRDIHLIRATAYGDRKC